MNTPPTNRRLAMKWPPAYAAWTVALTLVGCGQQEVSPAPTAGISVAAAQPSAPAMTAPSLPNMVLQCDDFATVAAGDYMIENNTWGKGQMTGWQQCVGLAPHPRGGVAGLWNWDWKYEGDQVKAYPEVIYGHKPGYPKSTTPALPRQLQQLSGVQMAYEVHSSRQGSGNLSLDIWFTNTATPTTFSVPTITHEVMIWLNVEGTMYAGGQQVDETTLNGIPYKVFVGEHFGMGWRYIAFTPVNATSPGKPLSGTLDLWAYFNYLRDKKWLNADAYLAAVNFGNEIISGAGQTQLYRLAVKTQEK
ncbi:MAG: hypothetical protein RLZZ612_936 [Pseudomonadota bacterium]